MDSLKEIRSRLVRLAAGEGDSQGICHQLSSGEALCGATDANGNTALHYAAASGRVDVIHLLLLRGANINALNQEKRGPLHLAAESGHVSSVQVLLEAGANVNLRAGRDECSVLDLAVISGYPGIVEALHLATYINASKTIDELASVGANLNARDLAGWTPLHVAADRGAFEAAVTLIKHGANPDIFDQESRTPLYLSVVKGDVPMVRALLTGNADATCRFTSHELFGGRQYSLLELALCHKEYGPRRYALDCQFIPQKSVYIELLIILAGQGSDLNAVNSEGESLLHVAAKRNKTVGVDFLIKVGVRVSSKDNAGFTPLHVASERGYLEVVRILLKSGAKGDIRSDHDDNALDLACHHGHKKVVSELLQHARIDVNAKNAAGSTALHHATRGSSFVQVVVQLIEAGARVDCSRLDGWTPLHLASARGNHEVVKVLLRRGADKDRLNNEGWAPLHLAALRGKYSAAIALLNAGANTNLHAGDGMQSTLQLVISGGLTHILQDVIRQGADVEYADIGGRTALHLAANNGKEEAINMLLQAGANVNAKEYDGWTALHYAVQRISSASMSALLAYGADVNAQDSEGVSPLHIAAGEAGRNDILFKALTIEPHLSRYERVRELLDPRSIFRFLFHLERDYLREKIQNITTWEKESAYRILKQVDTLLKRGANEKLKTAYGQTPLDLVGRIVHLDPEEQKLRKVHSQWKLVHNLLARAPADRAWRRRGLFLMCCFHRYGARGKGSAGNPAQDPSLLTSLSDDDANPHRDGNSAKLAKYYDEDVWAQREGSSAYGEGPFAGDVSARDESKATAENWHALVKRVLGLKEEGLFRAIIYFL